VDLLAGRIQLAFLSILAAKAQIDAEELRAIAVTSARRQRSLLDISAIAESGILRCEVFNWYGALSMRLRSTTFPKRDSYFIAVLGTPQKK
jgi:tripartite-type tricarboxylate transporter receptor subunit TctC